MPAILQSGYQMPQFWLTLDPKSMYRSTLSHSISAQTDLKVQDKSSQSMAIMWHQKTVQWQKISFHILVNKMFDLTRSKWAITSLSLFLEQWKCYLNSTYYFIKQHQILHIEFHWVQSEFWQIISLALCVRCRQYCTVGTGCRSFGWLWIQSLWIFGTAQPSPSVLSQF